MKLIKRKLNRRGKELYNKYFFNPLDTLIYIVEQFDNNLPIDNNKCEVIFQTNSITMEQIYEIIRYYPNKLKEKKYIDDNFIYSLYNEYGETIKIMKENTGSQIRNRLCAGAKYRSKVNNIETNINSEDVKLVRICPYLKIPLEYNNSDRTNYSASLDKIDPNKGYIKENIQVISVLANQMKSNANKEELKTFAKTIMELY